MYIPFEQLFCRKKVQMEKKWNKFKKQKMLNMMM